MKTDNRNDLIFAWPGLFLLTTLFSIYVPLHSDKAVNLYGLGGTTRLAYIGPILFAGSLVILFWIKRKWSVVASNILLLLGVIAIIMVNMKYTNTAAATQEPYTSITIVLYFIITPALLLGNIIKLIRGTKAKPSRAAAESGQAISEAKPIDFFVVSPGKLIIMYLTTLSFYDIYWFYRNWKAVEKAENSKRHAILLGIGAGLASYGIFRRVKGLPSPAVIALVYILLSYGAFDLRGAWQLLVYLGIVPLLYVQQTMRATDKVKVSAKFSKAELAIAICGGIFTILFVIGTLAPKP